MSLRPAGLIVVAALAGMLTVHATVLRPSLVHAADSTAAPRAYDAEIARRSAAVEKDVIAWRRHIHQIPELSNREIKTGAMVEEKLRAMGLEVRTGVAKTGVVALLRGASDGPVVALRADMDALPVTEEKGGADVMVEEGVLRNPAVEAIFGMHVINTDFGTIGYRAEGLMAASDHLRFVVRGVQAHGGRPWEGVDPIVVGSQIVMGLQTIVSRQTDLTLAREIPGFYVYLGANPPGLPEERSAPNHSPRFAIEEDALVIGVRMMSSLAMDYLADGARNPKGRE